MPKTNVAGKNNSSCQRMLICVSIVVHISESQEGNTPEAGFVKKLFQRSENLSTYNETNLKSTIFAQQNLMFSALNKRGFLFNVHLGLPRTV